MALKRRVVVVGLGSIGRRHARLLLERDDLAIEVLEPNVETLGAVRAELGDARAHQDFGAMLETEPDVVWLATPTDRHAEQSIAALRAGAHVFCEKPMTFDLDEGRAVEEAADRSAKVFNVGFYLHFWRGMMLLKGMIERGTLGNILHLHARVGTYVTLVNSVSRYQANRPGSLFFDYSHQPDFFYWLLGRIPRTVFVAAFQGREMEFTSDPNVADIICEYDSPLVTSIHLNYVQMPQRHEYEVVGDEGWALLDFERSSLTIGQRRAQTVKTQTFSHHRDDIFRAEQQAFFEAVEGKRRPETGAADGLVSVAVCEAALESYRTGEKVPLRI